MMPPADLLPPLTPCPPCPVALRPPGSGRVKRRTRGDTISRVLLKSEEAPTNTGSSLSPFSILPSFLRKALPEMIGIPQADCLCSAGDRCCAGDLCHPLDADFTTFAPRRDVPTRNEEESSIMEYQECRIGRTFVARLEEGESLYRGNRKPRRERIHPVRFRSHSGGNPPGRGCHRTDESLQPGKPRTDGATLRRRAGTGWGRHALSL